MHKLLLLIILTTTSQLLFAQKKVLWSEYFNDYPNGTEFGTGYDFRSTNSANAKWKVQRHYWNITSVQNGKYNAHSSGTDRFESESIDISKFRNVSIKVKYEIRGNSNTYILFDYWARGAWTRMAQVNAPNNGTTQTGTIEYNVPSNVNSLELYFLTRVYFNSHDIKIDDIEIWGEFKEPIGDVISNGKLTVRYFDNINGSRVSDLRNAPNFNHTISEETTVNSFQIQTNRRDRYGTEIRGYIIPPSTGYYTFLISANNNAEFRISTNQERSGLPTNPTAYNDPNTPENEFFNSNARNSKSVFLVESKAYYIEALHKEDRGADYFAIAWLKPGTKNYQVVPHYAISTELVPPADFTIVTWNISCTGDNDGKVKATPTGGRPPYKYQLNGGAPQNGDTFSNLTPGAYTITVTDDTGASMSKNFEIKEPAPIAMTIQEEKCVCNTCDGLAAVNITGGTEPFQLTWSDGVTSSQSTYRYVYFKSPNAISDYQIEVDVPYYERMEPDFSDIRFTDLFGNTLPFWIEEFTPSTSATIWVKVATVKTGDNKIMMHYSVPPDPSTASNINNVMTAGGLNVQYFKNRTLSGTPTNCIDNKALNYTFPDGYNVIVGNCGITTYQNNLSIIWTGWIRNPQPVDRVYMNVQTDDGVVLKLNDTDVISSWKYNPPTYYHGWYTFTGPIARLEYRFFEGGGNAYAQLGSSRSTTGGIGAIIPRGNYYHRNIVDNPPYDITIGTENRGLAFRRDLCEGDYSLTVNDINNCSVTKSVTIQKYNITFSLDNDETCSHDSNTITASSSIAPLKGNILYEFLIDGVSYQKSAAKTFVVPKNLTGGIHNVEVNIEVSLADFPDVCNKVANSNIRIHTDIETGKITLLN